MERLIKDEAIVLKKSYVGDTDLSVLVYTKKTGKENIYIPKGQLIKHPYLPFLEPSNWIKGVFSFKKDKVYLEEIDNYKLLALDIVKDLDKFNTLFKVFDIFNKYVGFPDERMFILLKKTLYYLSVEKDVSLHNLNFLVKFIHLYGIFPELEFCSICGEEINRKNFVGLLADFSASVCKKCQKKKKGINYTLNFNDILLLETLKNIQFKNLKDLKIPQKTEKKLTSFLEHYLKRQTE